MLQAFCAHLQAKGHCARSQEQLWPSNAATSFLLTCRKGSHGAGHWALPGGKLDFGESLEACGAREVLEETGIDVASATMQRVWVTSAVFAHDTHFVTVFLQAEMPQVMPLPERTSSFDLV